MSRANDPPSSGGLSGAGMLPPLDQPPVRPPARKPSRDRFAELNGFIDLTLATLTGAEAAVWLVLFRDTKAATGTARTGQEDIARRAGITSRGVRKALTNLTQKGLLKVVARGRIGAGPSAYRVRGVNPDRAR